MEGTRKLWIRAARWLIIGAVLFLILSAVMPLPSAIATSVLWRVVMILDKFTCVSACLVPTLAANLGRAPITPARATIGEANSYEADQK